MTPEGRAIKRFLKVVPLSLLFLPACGGGPMCGEGQEELDLYAGPGDFLYQDDVILQFDLDMEPEDIEALADTPRAVVPDVHALFSLGFETWDVGVHLKGSTSFRTIENKPAFAIDFHQWNPEASFHGVRRLTLNNMVQDPSMMGENLAYRFFSALGVPSPRQGFACVSLNGADLGLYSLVETMDEQFLERAFDDPDGNLYEGVAGSDLYGHQYRLFEIEEDGDGDVREDLRVLTEALDAATPDTFLSVLDRHFDRDALFHFLMGELAIGSVDSYIARSSNFLLYHEDLADRWSFIPWGTDQVFSEHLDIALSATPGTHIGRVYGTCLSSPSCRTVMETYLRASAEAMEGLDLAGVAEDLRERVATLSRDDPQSGDSCYEVWAHQRETVRYIRQRPDELREQVE